ncbi:hypothetical protein QFZ23_002352 [Arthrobacter globiformis]|nr:hypothetical protein [Arthrobacter globiformis]
MYRKGLSRDQIARLVRAARSTVGYHLKIARKLEPGLEAEHAATAGTKPAPATPQGLERMHQLVSWVQKSGRLSVPAVPQRNRADTRGLAAAEAGGRAGRDPCRGVPVRSSRAAGLADPAARRGGRGKVASTACSAYRLPGSRARLAAAQSSNHRCRARPGRLAALPTLKVPPRRAGRVQNPGAGPGSAWLAKRQATGKETAPVPGWRMKLEETLKTPHGPPQTGGKSDPPLSGRPCISQCAHPTLVLSLKHR